MKEELRIELRVDGADTATKDIKNTKEEVKDLGEETKSTSKETTQASKEVDKAYKAIGSAAKTGLTAATAAIAAAGAALVGIAESTRDYRTAQGKLVTAFKTAGSSAQVATKVYEDLNGVLGDSDVAVEAAGHLAKLTTNEKDLQKWTDICAGVFATFGDSLPIEGLTEAANETAKTGQLTGGLADALNWAGVAEDEFQASLDACSSEQERQALITETLSGLYQDAANSYKATNAEIIAANRATEDWNAQMAQMGGYIEPAITGFKELGTSVLKGLEEPIKSVVDWLTKDFIPAIQNTIKWVEENQEVVVAAGAAIAAGYVAYKAAAYSAQLAEEGLTIARVAGTAAQTALNAVMNLNPYVLLATGIAALAAGLVVYSNELYNSQLGVHVLNEEEQKLVDSISEETEALNQRQEAYEKAVGAVQSQMNHTTALADELIRLADENGKVKEADEVRAQFILNELNDALGTEYEMVDGIIQQYGTLKDTIYEVIQAKTANSMLEAKNADYVAAIEAEDEALKKLTAAEKDYSAQEEKTLAAKKEADKYMKESAAEMTEMDWENWRRKQQLYLDEKKILDEKKAKYDEAATNYGTYYNTIQEYEEAAMLIQQGKSKEAIEILKNKTGSYFEYAEGVSEATKQAVDALYKEAVDTGIEAKRIKQNFENGVAGYTKEMVEEAEKAHEDAMNEWANAYSEANGLGKDMGDGLGDGLDSKKSSLLSRARNLINSIWSTMRQAADSHSPSRKTMALGSDMGEGLKIGMDKSTARTAQAAENLVQNTLIPIEASISGVSWNNLDKAFSTTLAPIGNVNLSSETMLKVLNEETALQPIILQVDGKTFAEISVNSINQLTKQRGNLPLVMA